MHRHAGRQGDRAAPGMADLDVVELGEGLEERGGQAPVNLDLPVRLGVGLVVEVVAQAATEQHAVVLGQTHVVELGAGVVDALAIGPAKPSELLVAQGLGRDDAVADRRDPALDLLVAGAEGIGCEQHAAGPDLAVVGLDQDLRAARLEPGQRGELVDLDAKLERARLQAPAKLRRMQRAAVGAGVHAGREQRRAQLLLNLVPVEKDDVVAVLLVQLELPFDVGNVGLADGDRHLAAPLDLRVDLVAGQGVVEALEIVPPERLERFHVVGVEPERIGQTMHHRGREDRAGPRRGAGRNGLGLDQHDLAGRVGLLGLKRRPQPGKAAADDHQIGLAAPDQRPFDGRRRRIVEPQGEERHLAQRTIDGV